MMDLASKKCVPCQGGELPMEKEDVERYLSEVEEGWGTQGDWKKISKDFEFADFKQAIAFVNRVGELAELEGHHPDIFLYDYKKVKIILWTHEIDGLHQNDFILAVKIDKL